MKSLLLVFVSTTLFISGCGQNNKVSQANQTVTSNEVKTMLAAVSDSVRREGFSGWIPFLHNSTEFKWTFGGAEVPYDSIVARFRRMPLRLASLQVEWDSVRVEPLLENEAKLSALCSQTLTGAKGEEVTVGYDFTGDLQKINGSWKFHACAMSEHRQPHTDRKVAEADTSRHLYDIMDGLLKAKYGSLYEARDVLDADDRTANAAYRIYQDMGFIFEDPNQQLAHSFIVLFTHYEMDGHTSCDSGSIAIVRNNNITWCSKQLITQLDLCRISGFGDLNNDGITDILVTNHLGMKGDAEALWILSPDSSGGRLLNETDKESQSTITGSGSVRVVQRKGELTKRIEIDDLDEHRQVYTWNGRYFSLSKTGN